MTKKLGPVIIELRIEDCCECPFCDCDESVTICEKGVRNLPVYNSPDMVITPPARCPFRQDNLKRGGKHCFGSFYDYHSPICRECIRAKKCKAKLIEVEAH